MINIGFLVSYDYEYLFTALPLVYDEADKIVLAIDKNRKTWSGNPIEIAADFFDRIQALDTRRIIEIYEDDFYVPELTPMECDTRERTMLSKRLGKGWKIQLDADEYLYDFKFFASFLKKHHFLARLNWLLPINFHAECITLFKTVDNGYLLIENSEQFPLVTNVNQYSEARKTTNTININLTTQVIHQSWARSAGEIKQKIFNWGHRDDFDVSAFFEFWKTVDASNYDTFKNFHPLAADIWKTLVFVPAKDIDELIATYVKQKPQQIQYSLARILQKSFSVNTKRVKLFFKKLFGITK